MKSNNYLTKNLAQLAKINAKLAYQINTADASELEFCQTEAGERNLRRTYQGTTYYYHSQTGAIQEAKEWFQNLAIQNATVLYVYGIGLGYYYQAAKEWLNSHPQHALVFLEEDLGVLYRFLETKEASSLLKNPQVHLYHFTDLLEDRALFNELSWTFILCSFIVSSLALYAEVNPSGFSQLHHQLSYDAAQKHALVDEYLQYGLAFFRNFYYNLLLLPKAYLGNRLFGRFQNIPAIICGAGPSLNKQIDLLKTLKNKALVFGGGSALNALTAQGLLPHFGAGIDPNQMQYERIKTTQDYPVPFFYRNRLFYKALAALQGPLLYLTGTGGYDIAEWFEEQLGIEGETLDEGHNVVNFCTEVAHALGCNPIIYVGVDLAYTNMQSYAEGIVLDFKVTESQLTHTTDFDSQALLREDIFGNPIYTLWKWVTESDWISNYAKEHPDVAFINATEGGLGFKEVPNKPLAEVAQDYLQKDENLEERIQAEIQPNALSYLTVDRIKELMQALRQSLIKCMEYFDAILEDMSQIARNIKQSKDYPSSLQTPKGALAEMEIGDEIGYQYLLNTFNLVYIRLRNRDIQSLQFPRRHLSEKSKNLKKIELHVQRIQFLKNVAAVNVDLIHKVLQEN
jgi:hypothetical protein